MTSPETTKSRSPLLRLLSFSFIFISIFLFLGLSSASAVIIDNTTEMDIHVDVSIGDFNVNFSKDTNLYDFTQCSFKNTACRMLRVDIEAGNFEYNNLGFFSEREYNLTSFIDIIDPDTGRSIVSSFSYGYIGRNITDTNLLGGRHDNRTLFNFVSIPYQYLESGVIIRTSIVSSRQKWDSQELLMLDLLDFSIFEDDPELSAIFSDISNDSSIQFIENPVFVQPLDTADEIYTLITSIEMDVSEKIGVSVIPSNRTAKIGDIINITINYGDFNNVQKATAEISYNTTSDNELINFTTTTNITARSNDSFIITVKCRGYDSKGTSSICGTNQNDGYKIFFNTLNNTQTGDIIYGDILPLPMTLCGIDVDSQEDVITALESGVPCATGTGQVGLTAGIRDVMTGSDIVRDIQGSTQVTQDWFLLDMPLLFENFGVPNGSDWDVVKIEQTCPGLPLKTADNSTICQTTSATGNGVLVHGIVTDACANFTAGGLIWNGRADGTAILNVSINTDLTWEQESSPGYQWWKFVWLPNSTAQKCNANFGQTQEATIQATFEANSNFDLQAFKSRDTRNTTPTFTDDFSSVTFFDGEPFSDSSFNFTLSDESSGFVYTENSPYSTHLSVKGVIAFENGSDFTVMTGIIDDNSLLFNTSVSRITLRFLDTFDNPVTGVDVQINDLNKILNTGSLSEIVFNDIPNGEHEIKAWKLENNQTILQSEQPQTIVVPNSEINNLYDIYMFSVVPPPSGMTFLDVKVITPNTTSNYNISIDSDGNDFPIYQNTIERKTLFEIDDDSFVFDTSGTVLVSTIFNGQVLKEQTEEIIVGIRNPITIDLTTDLNVIDFEDRQNTVITPDGETFFGASADGIADFAGLFTQILLVLAGGNEILLAMIVMAILVFLMNGENKVPEETQKIVIGGAFFFLLMLGYIPSTIGLFVIVIIVALGANKIYQRTSSESGQI